MATNYKNYQVIEVVLLNIQDWQREGDFEMILTFYSLRAKLKENNKEYGYPYIWLTSFRNRLVPSPQK